MLQMRLDYMLIMYIVQSSQQHLRDDVMIFKKRESSLWSLRISCVSTLIVKLEMTIFAICFGNQLSQFPIHFNAITRIVCGVNGAHKRTTYLNWKECVLSNIQGQF